MGWRRVRKAKIDNSERDIFERYGENVLGNTLASGLNPISEELNGIFTNKTRREHVVAWLTERGDKQANREFRLEMIEWAIVVLIAVEIALTLVKWNR